MRSPSGTPSEKTNDTRSKGGPAAAADSGEAPGSNWRMAQTLRGFEVGSITNRQPTVQMVDDVAISLVHVLTPVLLHKPHRPRSAHRTV